MTAEIGQAAIFLSVLSGLWAIGFPLHRTTHAKSERHPERQKRRRRHLHPHQYCDRCLNLRFCNRRFLNALCC